MVVRQMSYLLDFNATFMIIMNLPLRRVLKLPRIVGLSLSTSLPRVVKRINQFRLEFRNF